MNYDVAFRLENVESQWTFHKLVDMGSWFSKIIVTCENNYSR